MFLTSMFITQGMTHMMTTGKTKMSRGRKELRLICRNSFWIRYFSVISFKTISTHNITVSL